MRTLTALRLFSILIIAVSTWGASALPDVNYTKPQRVLYLQATLDAFKSLERQTMLDTYEYLANLNSYSCGSPVEQLRIQCLLQSAEQNCEGKTFTAKDFCQLTSDVVITNLVEEGSFMSRSDRYRILKRSVNDRDQVLRALFRRYARLVTDFMTRDFECSASDLACVARELDGYCLKRSDEKALSWQGCASAALWFIGLNFRGGE